MPAARPASPASDTATWRRFLCAVCQKAQWSVHTGTSCWLRMAWSDNTGRHAVQPSCLIPA
eukprot:scaffold5819_cov115-Isochrysis_galbana.AAC.7